MPLLSPLLPQAHKRGQRHQMALVLAAGLRGPAAPQRSPLGLQASPSCCPAQPPSWQRSRARGQPPPHEASSPCQLPLPSLPLGQPSRRGRGSGQTRQLKSRKCPQVSEPQYQSAGPSGLWGHWDFPGGIGVPGNLLFLWNRLCQGRASAIGERATEEFTVRPPPQKKT